MRKALKYQCSRLIHVFRNNPSGQRLAEQRNNRASLLGNVRGSNILRATARISRIPGVPDQGQLRRRWSRLQQSYWGVMDPSIDDLGKLFGSISGLPRVPGNGETQGPKIQY